MVRFFHSKLNQRWQGEKISMKSLASLDSTSQKKCLWFHCASLGEFEQARPLIETLQKKRNNYFVAITFFSSSGYEVQKNYAHANWVGYIPWDQKKALTPFLNELKPDIVFLVKYEFWPNLLVTLRERNIPTFSLCGRFYASQFFFKPYGKWMLKYLKGIRGFMVVDEASEGLLKKHGLKPIVKVGDLRMDRVLNLMGENKSNPNIEAFLENKKCFVVGSSWPEDYPLFLDYLLTQTDVKIIIAPHEVSAKSMAKLNEQILLEKAYWSSFNLNRDNHKRVFIIDRIGYLAQTYQYAHWAYVGGGMGTKGLHNILEAVVYGIPVFIGKNYQNFKEAEDLVQQKGVLSVQNAEEFRVAFEAINPQRRAAVNATNKKYVEKHRGATQKCIDYLTPHLNFQQ